VGGPHNYSIEKICQRQVREILGLTVFAALGFLDPTDFSIIIILYDKNAYNT
jgi:hypothetical protein